MNLNSLLCSLLAAYACGASGTYEKPRREVYSLRNKGQALLWTG
ncbi:hypothetical protein [Pseudomonas sp. R3-56]